MRLVSSIVCVVIAACGSQSSLKAEAPAAPSLRSELAARRAIQIERLHDYRVAGEFPMDGGFPASVFIDAAGRQCPMAALIAQSGHEALVDEVARKNNELRLADVHEGPLVDWILESGLTKDEVVEIQGAMTIEFGPGELETKSNVMTALVEHMIREKLRKIEDKLRVTTAVSLLVAEARSPKGPHVPSLLPAMPKQLEAKTPWMPRRTSPYAMLLRPQRKL
ncbi:MAG: hypothetical protein JWO36_7137 [Myxococcales bacterium]|nr:hypothetical protein [Myxococcales bacterium]